MREHIELELEPPIILRSGDIVLDTAARRVTLAGEPLDIRGLTYKFMLALMQADRDLVSVATLTDTVWGKKIVSEDVITQRASLLRKALGSVSADYFEVERGQGYRWRRLVTVDQGAPFEGPVSSETDNPSHDTPGTVTEKRVFSPFMGGVAACLVFGLLLAVGLWNRSDQGAHDPSNFGRDGADVDVVGRTNIPLRLQRAVELAAQGTSVSNKLAITLFEQYLEDHPDDTRALLGYATVLLQRAAKYDGGDIHLLKADGAISRLESEGGTTPDLMWLKGYYYDVAGDIDQAIAYYESALTPDYAGRKRVATSLAYLYVRRGRLFEALQLNLSALEEGGDYRILQVAETLYLAQMDQEAGRWFALAYELAPNDGFTAVQYARFLHRVGKPLEAETVLDRFHALDAQTGFSLTARAVMLVHAGRLQDAFDTLQQEDAATPTIYSTGLRYWLSKQLGITAPKPPISLEDGAWPNAYVAMSLMPLADGDRSAAMAYLSKAQSAGFLDVRSLTAYAPFQALADRADYKRLITAMTSSTMAEKAKISLLELPDPALLTAPPKPVR